MMTVFFIRFSILRDRDLVVHSELLLFSEVCVPLKEGFINLKKLGENIPSIYLLYPVPPFKYVTYDSLLKKTNTVIVNIFPWSLVTVIYMNKVEILEGMARGIIDLEFQGHWGWGGFEQLGISKC